MDNDQQLSEDNVVQHPERKISENGLSTDKITRIITGERNADNDGSMDIVYSHVTETPNSVIDISKINHDTLELIEYVRITESSSLSNQCDETNADKSVPTIERNSLDSEDPSAINVSSNVEIGKNIENNKPASSLSVIALAYENSDSESEECKMVGLKRNNDGYKSMEIQITKEYRNVPATIQEDSDSDESSSIASSLASDVESDLSNRDGDNSGESENTKKISGKKKGARTEECRKKELKGEYDDLPPIEELKISVPEVLCDPLGEVAWMVDQMVVVRPKPGKPTLNIDTVLFVERGRRVLGRIFDVFGQVSDPHYCVRFNSSEHIQQSDIKVGMIAYFCPNTEYTSVVFLQDLLKMKATDELGEDEHPEFSDDEEERAYYAALKQKQKSERAKTGEAIPQKRQRTDPGWKSNHPWSSAGRKQDQTKKPDRSYESPVFSGETQQNVHNSSNLWQQQQRQQQQPYPSVHPNILWRPGSESYQGNVWPPHNPYGYSESFQNHRPQGSTRPFFRPPRPFKSGPVAYTQNRPYDQHSNPPRYPPIHFPWQSPVPRQSGSSWSFPPPPPPPPPPGT